MLAYSSRGITKNLRAVKAKHTFLLYEYLAEMSVLSKGEITQNEINYGTFTLTDQDRLISRKLRSKFKFGRSEEKTLVR